MLSVIKWIIMTCIFFLGSETSRTMFFFPTKLLCVYYQDPKKSYKLTNVITDIGDIDFQTDQVNDGLNLNQGLSLVLIMRPDYASFL